MRPGGQGGRDDGGDESEPVRRSETGIHVSRPTCPINAPTIVPAAPSSVASTITVASRDTPSSQGTEDRLGRSPNRRNPIADRSPARPPCRRRLHARKPIPAPCHVRRRDAAAHVEPRDARLRQRERRTARQRDDRACPRSRAPGCRRMGRRREWRSRMRAPAETPAIGHAARLLCAERRAGRGAGEHDRRDGAGPNGDGLSRAQCGVVLPGARGGSAARLACSDMMRVMKRCPSPIRSTSSAIASRAVEAPSRAAHHPHPLEQRLGARRAVAGADPQRGEADRRGEQPGATQGEELGEVVDVDHGPRRRVDG